jgi:hypothetical protein
VYRFRDEDLPDAIEYLEWLIAERTPPPSGRQPDRRLRDEDEAYEYRGLHPDIQGVAFRLLQEASALTGDHDEARDWLRLKLEHDPQQRTLREEIDRFLDDTPPA